MAPLRIAYLTSEVAPFVKVGGLADVSAALPAFLARAGHDARVFVPFYGRIDRRAYPFETVDNVRDVPVRLGAHAFSFTLRRLLAPGGSAVYFVDCPPLYARQAVYGAGDDEHLRFLLLQRATLEACRRMGFAPHVFHANDWPTALVPLDLKTVDSWDRLFHGSKTLLTIHNLGYQGVFPASCLPDTGLGQDAHHLHQEDLGAGRINFLKTGILYASFLSTVSPTYAREIQTEELGMGLHDLLRARSDHLVGILNGVDYGEWSPETDRYIPVRYSAASLEGKEKNKQALLAELRLPYVAGVPVAGMVSRLAWQKGVDLAIEVLTVLLRRRDLQLAVLGSGEPRLEELFARLERDFPRQVRFVNRFSNPLAHRIEAGADLFLMPSRYEPCGLNQMYSLRYGTVPVVRRTGGLADTVEPWDPATQQGTGFVFGPPTPEGLFSALEPALDAYRDRKAWRRLMENGMARDYSWEVQGRRYVELYRHLAGGSA